MSARGTTNGNARGSSYERRRRRAWMMTAWASDKPGLVRCYRCGCLLFNPDDYPDTDGVLWWPVGESLRIAANPLTIDRITPGCQGGTYRRNNIRPACGTCNSETGGATRRKGKP